MNNILEKCKNTRILATIGIVGLILGTMLTYVEFSFWGYTQPISLWGYWEGKIVLLLALANVLLIFRDIVEKYIPQLFNTNLGKKLANITNPKASLVPTILAVAFAAYLHMHLDIDTEYASYGLGFYSLWVGSISLVAYAILHKNDYRATETTMEETEMRDETEIKM